MNAFINLTTRMLHIANSDPPSRFAWFSSRYRFFVIKERILKKHGKYIAYVYQEIKKECWSCGGAGIYYSNYHHFTEDCFKCGGTGIYEYFWVLLHEYQLGKYIFHIPQERIKKPALIILPNRMIQGHVAHKPYSKRKTRTARLYLAAIYDRKWFYYLTIGTWVERLKNKYYSMRRDFRYWRFKVTGKQDEVPF